MSLLCFDVKQIIFLNQTDVIGVVTCVNPIEERTTVNGKVDMMSLQLKNGRCVMICYTWFTLFVLHYLIAHFFIIWSFETFGRGDVFKVTLWDEYVAIFNQTLKEQMYDAPKPNVAIFTSVTVKQYQGNIASNISNRFK
jgi:hypothetical protein